MALASLLEQVAKNSPAHVELTQRGVRPLIRAFDEQREADSGDARYLMDLLWVLAMFGGREGAQRIVGAARAPTLTPNSATVRSLWYSVLTDHRLLDWPPAGDRIPLWIVRYEVDSDSTQGTSESDCGVVGSTTWCFFDGCMELRPPEDCYAAHCCWELGLYPDEADDSPRNARLLAQYRDGSLENAAVTHIVRIPRSLKYPRRIVALASADMDGEPGWAVLDGPDSRWHRKADLPDGRHEEATLLMIHVGRRLLGFDAPTRSAASWRLMRLRGTGQGSQASR